MQLIYHEIDVKNQISKFDKAILDVATNAPLLRLASPYIGLSYLVRITNESQDWKLISDVEAWLQSGNRKHRVSCWDFITQNIARIRHIPNLHAKVAIGNNKLFLGSANFTNTGIQNRTELSALISENAAVTESIAWFDRLWDSAIAPIISEGDELVTALNEQQWTSPRTRIHLTSSSSAVYGALVDTKRPVNGLDVAKVMAVAGLDEIKALQPLNTAYEIFSQQSLQDRATFSFRYLLSELKKQCGAVSTPTVLQLITKHTVNHVPGGFDLTGYDRFVFIDNLFQPWEAQHLGYIKSLDKALLFLIEELLFDSDSYLPLEHKWLSVGISPSKILPMVDQLIMAGLVSVTDIAGDVEQFRLADDLEWPTRWNKFSQSHALFKSKLADFQKNKNITTNEIEVPEILYQDDLAWKNIGQKDPYYLKVIMLDDIQKQASSKNLSQEVLIKAQDDELTSAFKILKFSGFLQIEELNTILKELKTIGIPKLLLDELKRANNGAFVSTAEKTYIKSKSWKSGNYLQLYPIALKQWLSIA